MFSIKKYFFEKIYSTEKTINIKDFTGIKAYKFARSSRTPHP